MNRYELLVLMTAGMATIAGSVMVIYASMLGEQFQGVLGHLITKSIMSVPASILFAHVMLPDAAEQDHGDCSSRRASMTARWTRSRAAPRTA
jgi:CNT family concentrative nucleoside transporter